jgi:hypothetical protein
MYVYTYVRVCVGGGGIKLNTHAKTHTHRGASVGATTDDNVVGRNSEPADNLQHSIGGVR